jgi:flagellar hook protein FlgE
VLTSLRSGVSGLRSYQTELEVTGNNLANVNSTAFKATKTSFGDILSKTLSPGQSPADVRGGVNPMQVGSGVKVASLNVSHSQGDIAYTSRDADVAIDGAGFFVLNNGSSLAYTRDGSFGLDKDGYLTSVGTGLKVVGWTADSADGKVNTSSAPDPAGLIRVPLGSDRMAMATSRIEMSGNLDAVGVEGAQASARFQVFDSVGAGRDLLVIFTRQADGWLWEARENDAAAPAGTGLLTFDEAGRPSTGSLAELSLRPAGSSSDSPRIATLDLSGLTQMASPTNVQLGSQNGLPPGLLVGFFIDGDGSVIGHYENGLERPLAKLALARFSNPAGLQKAGGNLWTSAPNAGEPRMQDAAALGSRLVGGALEASNVDMAEEFTRMIVAQRAFQANARMITASDQVLQELMQLSR